MGSAGLIIKPCQWRTRDRWFICSKEFIVVLRLYSWRTHHESMGFYELEINKCRFDGNISALVTSCTQLTIHWRGTLMSPFLQSPSINAFVFTLHWIVLLQFNAKFRYCGRRGLSSSVIGSKFNLCTMTSLTQRMPFLEERTETDEQLTHCNVATAIYNADCFQTIQKPMRSQHSYYVTVYARTVSNLTLVQCSFCNLLKTSLSMFRSQRWHLVHAGFNDVVALRAATKTLKDAKGAYTCHVNWRSDFRRSNKTCKTKEIVMFCCF